MSFANFNGTLGEYISTLKEGVNTLKEGAIKVKEFTSTVTSGFISDKDIKERLLVCNNCQFCHKEVNKWYCKACGCPHWHLSELHTKLKFEAASCPKGYF